ncbi:MAG: AEC family transporter [Gemmatimonadota bacterium]
MATLLNTVAPVFGILLLGFLAVRVRMLEEAGVQGLVIFVFNFAIPLLLYRSLATTELPEDIRWSFILSFYGGSFACYFLGMALGRGVFRRNLADQAIFGMSAGFSNTVLMGIPILLTAYGPEATLPIFLLIAFHGPTLMPLTTALIQVGRGGEVSVARQVRTVLWELVRNPIIMGLLLGLAANLAGFALSGGLDRTVELLGSAAIPCALFAMGASLAGYPLMGDVAPALLLGAVKLILHPLLVWVLAVPVFGLDGIWVPVAVTMAAMPSGVNAYLFGARYDAAPGVAARTILLGTVVSVGTISLVLVLFQ